MQQEKENRSNIDRVAGWFETHPAGTCFTSRELAEELGINRDSIHHVLDINFYHKYDTDGHNKTILPDDGFPDPLPADNIPHSEGVKTFLPQGKVFKLPDLSDRRTGRKPSLDMYEKNTS